MEGNRVGLARGGLARVLLRAPRAQARVGDGKDLVQVRERADVEGLRHDLLALQVLKEARAPRGDLAFGVVD